MAAPHYVRFEYGILEDGPGGLHPVQAKMLVYGSHCLVEVPGRDDYRLALLEKMDELGWSFKTSVANISDRNSLYEKWIFRKEMTR